jgi:hypothetical protein
MKRSQVSGEGCGHKPSLYTHSSGIERGGLCADGTTTMGHQGLCPIAMRPVHRFTSGADESKFAIKEGLRTADSLPCQSEG